MVALHPVDDGLVLPVLLQDLPAELEVRALLLAVDGLADVVQEPRSLGDGDVRAELAREVARGPADFLRMLEDALPVARAVLQPAEELHDLGVQVGDAELERRGLAGRLDVLPELLADLLDDLLDAGRVDAPVLDEALEGATRNLAADRVERGEEDRLGRVVDDDVDARRGLDGADVPALAADDATLHVVGREVEDRHGRLDHVVRGHALDRHRQEALRLPVRALDGVLLDATDETRRLETRLVLELPDEVALGLLGREARDDLELRALLGDDGLRGLLRLFLQLLHALLALREVLGAVLGVLLALLGRQDLLVERLFLLEEPLFLVEELGAALGGLGLRRLAGLELPLLGVQLGFLGRGLRPADGGFCV